MGWLIFTLAAFTAFILVVEWACWALFSRKIEPLRFPSRPERSHTYYLDRLRVFAFAHTMALIAFIWIFCIVLWW